jgi:hypothetical protein
MSKATRTLAIAALVAGCASAAFAQSPSPYTGGYGAYGSPPPPDVGNCRVVRNQDASPDGRANPRMYVDCD